jgi:3-oxo-5-alpha-steroid 4-dehydrogenase 1
MIFVAVIVFIALYFINAGYGMFNNGKWGRSINNKAGWIIMEAPVFLVLMCLWLLSDRKQMLVPDIMICLMLLHYFQRAFIFPFLFKSNSKMPLVIVGMGILFNLINAFIQGGWILYLSPVDMYTTDWLLTPQFNIGIFLFFTGMAINLHSDHVIRNLRKPGDTNHYLPEKGLYKYITSANYFGEIVEWIGFAILTWSLAGAVFAIWTCANLIPRANSIYINYKKEFGDKVMNRKRVIPFIY